METEVVGRATWSDSSAEKLSVATLPVSYIFYWVQVPLQVYLAISHTPRQMKRSVGEQTSKVLEKLAVRAFRNATKMASQWAS